VLASAGDDPPGVGVAPSRKPVEGGGEDVLRPGSGYVRYFLLDESEAYGRRIPMHVSIRDRRVHAESEGGLTYVLDPASGSAEILPSRTYRDDYEAQQAGDPTPEPLDSHLSKLRDRVVSFVPDAR
jgi:hypothetical protein